MQRLDKATIRLSQGGEPLVGVISRPSLSSLSHYLAIFDEGLNVAW